MSILKTGKSATLTRTVASVALALTAVAAFATAGNALRKAGKGGPPPPPGARRRAAPHGGARVPPRRKRRARHTAGHDPEQRHRLHRRWQHADPEPGHHGDPEVHLGLRRRPVPG